MDDITRKLFEKFINAYKENDTESISRLAKEISVRVEHVGRSGEYDKLLIDVINILLDAGEHATALEIGKRFLNPNVYTDAKLLAEIYILSGDIPRAMEIIYPHLDVVQIDPDFEPLMRFIEEIEKITDVPDEDFRQLDIERDPVIAQIVLILDQLGLGNSVNDQSLPYIYSILKRATRGFKGNKDSWAAAFVYFYNDIMGDTHVTATSIARITGVPPREIYRKSKILYRRFTEEELI